MGDQPTPHDIAAGNRKKVKAGKEWYRDPGRLPAKEERAAKGLAVPSIYAQAVLGMDLYPKQAKAVDSIQVFHPQKHVQVSISACNGAGKTTRLIPAMVLWFLSFFPRGKCKITSASWTQVEDQLYPALLRYKERYPRWRWFETPYIETRDQGFMRCFSTNEPGKAEGDHEDGVESPLLFIVDEAKSAQPWLRGVLEGRVRPTILVLMSSHGFAEGWFYESQTVNKADYTVINIAAEDCPHISPKEIDDIKKKWSGNPAFADSILGRGFIPLVEGAVINYKALDALLTNPPTFKDGDRAAFCDFAWSNLGAENTMAVRRGNKIHLRARFHCDHLVCRHEKDTPGIVERFISEFVQEGLEPHQITGDEGSGGKLVMDELEKRGWPINRFSWGSPAEDNEHYASAGAELWFHGATHIVRKSFILDINGADMDDIRGQLLNRKQVFNKQGKLAIESKQDMLERGVPSPDCADAILGAMLVAGGYGSTDLKWAIPMGVGRYRAVGG